MNPKYKEELITWSIRTIILIALSIILAMIQRWLGVSVVVEPPPVTIVVEPVPGTPGPPKVTVHRP